MNREGVLSHCAELPEVIEDYPFGDSVTVFKIGGHMFALVLLDDGPGIVDLKCGPLPGPGSPCALPVVNPGYHANKRHWNSAKLDGSINDSEIQSTIESFNRGDRPTAMP